MPHQDAIQFAASKRAFVGWMIAASNAPGARTHVVSLDYRPASIN
jgi:hypothetical protein